MNFPLYMGQLGALVALFCFVGADFKAQGTWTYIGAGALGWATAMTLFGGLLLLLESRDKR